MNRISARFAELAARGRKAFIAYLCAGDPDLDATVELVVAMAERAQADERVDIIELGIPYSDPMADGPANQAACERALRSGTTVAGVLAAVRRIRARTQVPLLFFTYLNPILAYGIERFAAEASASGVDGVLPLDLPPEEGPELRATLQAAGLATVCLSAPTTPPARKLMLMRESHGFLYYVCRLGVTGERAEQRARPQPPGRRPQARGRHPGVHRLRHLQPGAGGAGGRVRRRGDRRQPSRAPDRGAWPGCPAGRGGRQPRRRPGRGGAPGGRMRGAPW